jgi:hypothetical protein
LPSSLQVRAAFMLNITFCTMSDGYAVRCCRPDVGQRTIDVRHLNLSHPMFHHLLAPVFA